MAIQGLPPGLAKKAEAGSVDSLPGNNPHVKAYKAQQEADALKAENEKLQGQVGQLQEEQKTVSDVLGFINALLAAALQQKEGDAMKVEESPVAEEAPAEAPAEEAAAA